MKRILLLALVALGFLSMPIRRASAQSKFEGTITWAMTIPMMDEEKHDMIFSMKGDQAFVQMDLGAQGGMKMWTDRAARKTYMYMAALGNRGMIIDMPNDSVTLAKAKDLQLDLKATGQKANVAGHASEEYMMKTKDMDVSMWMASDFPQDLRDAFKHAMASNQQQDVNIARAMKELGDKGLVPVKMSVKKGGETAMTMELVKIEQKKLDDKVFERPANIEFKPMPAGMMNGMH